MVNGAEELVLWATVAARTCSGVKLGAVSALNISEVGSRWLEDAVMRYLD